MLKYYEEGYDDVYAKRRSRKGETIIKFLGNNRRIFRTGIYRGKK